MKLYRIKFWRICFSLFSGGNWKMPKITKNGSLKASIFLKNCLITSIFVYIVFIVNMLMRWKFRWFEHNLQKLGGKNHHKKVQFTRKVDQRPQISSLKITKTVWLLFQSLQVLKAYPKTLLKKKEIQGS